MMVTTGPSFWNIGYRLGSTYLHTRRTLVLATNLTNSRKFRGGNLTSLAVFAVKVSLSVFGSPMGSAVVPEKGLILVPD